MTNKTIITNDILQSLAERTAGQIYSIYESNKSLISNLKAYAIPRGGIPAMYAIRKYIDFKITENPSEADFFIDDILDSGKTMQHYCDLYPQKPFFTLIEKGDITLKNEYRNGWFVFPWEVSHENSDESFTDNVVRVFQYIGENPNRQGLLETPKRYQKALGEWFSGYKYSDSDIKSIFKSFEDGAEDSDEMVIRRNIPVYSHCEHHIAPIFGFVTVAYIPDKKVLGLSKMDRIVEVFSRRLQVQERLTNQIANAMWEHLNPIGVGVYLTARHMCIESRGVGNQSSETITTALRGAMKTKPETRAEFLAACRN